MFLDNRQVAMDSVLEALADSIDYFQDNIERLRPSLRDALKPHYTERLQQMRTLQELARAHLKNVATGCGCRAGRFSMAVEPFEEFRGQR